MESIERRLALTVLWKRQHEPCTRERPRVGDQAFVGQGLQVVAVGCLRGLGDMRSAVIANLVGFWLLGLTIGSALAFGAGMGPSGLWWGLAIGLFTVALGLMWVLRVRASQDRERLQVD